MRAALLAASLLLPAAAAAQQHGTWEGGVGSGSSGPDTTCLSAGVECLFAGSATEGGPATTALSLAAAPNLCPVGQWSGGINAAGEAQQCTVDDDVPESGDFGNAADLEADGSLSVDTVGLAELAACPGPDEIVEYGASGVPSCIPTPSGGGGGAATSLNYDADANSEVTPDGTSVHFDANDDGTADLTMDKPSGGNYSGRGRLNSAGGLGLTGSSVTLGDSGTPYWWASSTFFGSQGLNWQPYMMREIGTATNPVFVGGNDQTTGYAVIASGEGRLISSSSSVLGHTPTEVTTYVEQVNDPKPRTCADSGEGSPGTLIATVSGSTYLPVINQDPDGCTVTLSETGATNGQRLELAVVSSAGGTVDLNDTPPIQETGSGCSMAETGTATFRYAGDRWLLTSCRPTN